MRRAFHTAMLLTGLLAVPAAAHAGWVSDWTNTLIKRDGERADSQSSTMAIDAGRVRMQQPDVVTVTDYNTGRFTMMNPVKHSYWTGTVDEYVRDLTLYRRTQMRQTLGAAGAQSKKLREPDATEYKPPTIDPSKLPPVSVTKTATTEKIAGYDAVKYEVRADGELFQEFWYTPALNVSKDLDPARFAAVQQKMSAGMLGKSAQRLNALYRDPEYRKLIDSGFVLKVVNHHLGGQFERVATAVRQTDVPASEFEVPSTYRRVKLTEVLTTPQGS